MEIGVGVAPANQATENKLAAAVYDKSSPDYHHFLSVSQFHSEFGVDPVTSQAVKSYLINGGLKVNYASSGGDYFVASGTVAQLEQLFNVQIGKYSFKGKDLLANNVAPSVPATLPITGIAGLDTSQKFVPAALHGHKLSAALKLEKALSELAHVTHKTVVQKLEVAQIKHALASQASTSAVTSQDGDQLNYTPQDLWGIYNMPGASELTNSDGTSNVSAVENSKYALGQGQTIGIFMDGETSSVVAQLRLFEEAEGLPKVPVRTIESEGPQDSSYGDNTGAIEWYLDSQSSTGIAPDVKQLDFYSAKDLADANIFAEFDDWANDPTGPEEMNASFGECEENPTNVLTGGILDDLPIPYGTGLGDDVEAIGEPVLEQASLEGRTLFSSA
jgi:subtilase family serine protease